MASSAVGSPDCGPVKDIIEQEEDADFGLGGVEYANGDVEYANEDVEYANGDVAEAEPATLQKMYLSWTHQCTSSHKR